MGEFTLIETPSNEILAVQAQAGCRASFDELIARFQVPLLHFLRQRTGSLHDAEDLTQDVFVRAFRSLQRYEPRWRFSTWLYTIAHRLSLNARRRWRPPVDGRGLDAVSSVGSSPDDTLSTAEESSRLWRAAAAVLTAEQLTSLWLFYVEEMPLEEIARVLGRSPGAAKGLLFRGRRKLADSLQDSAERSVSAKRNETSVDPPQPVDAHLFKLLPPRLAAELYDG
jgi:RNA polymerase sigma-70 factor (ECF subfamily)